MLSNGNSTDCGFENEIVSYIYDEISTSKRRLFEGHLGKCEACTDEFAALSDARFSVFEWQKEDFAHLATPVVEIPYRSADGPAAAEAAGIMSGLLRWLSLAARPLAVATGLILIVGLAFFATAYFRTSGPDMGSNIVKDELVPPVPDNKTGSELISGEKAEQRVEDVKPRDPVTEIRQIEPKRTLRAVHRQSAEPRPSSVASRSIQSTPVTKTPALSSFDETDDKSLRLADLFDEEVGVR